MTVPAFTPTGIRFENIEKRYGSLYALRRVTLEIPSGECVAFAGRNGSGKTTLLRIAARLVRASSGKVTFMESSASGRRNKDDDATPPLFTAAEEKSDSKAAALQEKHGGVKPASAGRPLLQMDRRDEGEERDVEAAIGFVAHATMVYDELTAEENLVLFARLQGIADPGARAAALLEEVGLSERRKSLVRTFSRGMRQRVAIARALLNEPSVLLLDEPSTGLDPEGITWLANTLHRMRDAGRTILMSLHGESEISALATRAVRLDAGSVVADTRTRSDMHAILTFAGA